MDARGNYKLKVCGMRDVANIGHVGALEPDYMGFIFYPRSPRFVGKEFIVPDSLPASITRIGVFVNEPIDRVLSAAKANRLSGIQLHGNESPRDCEVLKENGLDVIKVFSVDEDFDFNHTKAYQPYADFFLFDTKGKYYGGNSEVFPWHVLKRYDQHVPFFLSGGLSPDNVEGVEKLSGLNLHAVDVNSGVEDSPGMKSTQKLKSFIHKLQTIK